MSNTEKLIKQLNTNKEIKKQMEEQKEKKIKPAVRIQQVKNNLIILAHELLVSKKINDSLYRKIQLLTYSKTSENKLNQSYETLKKLKTNIKKAEQLQGIFSLSLNIAAEFSTHSHVLSLIIVSCCC